jgi:hypothetical protein
MILMVGVKVCCHEFNLRNTRDKLLSYGWNSVGRKPLKIVPKYKKNSYNYKLLYIEYFI